MLTLKSALRYEWYSVVFFLILRRTSLPTFCIPEIPFSHILQENSFFFFFKQCSVKSFVSLKLKCKLWKHSLGCLQLTILSTWWHEGMHRMTSTAFQNSLRWERLGQKVKPIIFVNKCGQSHPAAAQRWPTWGPGTSWCLDRAPRGSPLKRGWIRFRFQCYGTRLKLAPWEHA